MPGDYNRVSESSARTARATVRSKTVSGAALIGKSASEKKAAKVAALKASGFLNSAGKAVKDRYKKRQIIRSSKTAKASGPTRRQVKAAGSRAKTIAGKRKAVRKAARR